MYYITEFLVYFIFWARNIKTNSISRGRITKHGRLLDHKVAILHIYIGSYERNLQYIPQTYVYYCGRISKHGRLLEHKIVILYIYWFLGTKFTVYILNTWLFKVLCILNIINQVQYRISFTTHLYIKGRPSCKSDMTSV